MPSMPSGCEDYDRWIAMNASWQRYLDEQRRKERFEEMPVDINSCFPGNYLKAADLQGRTIKCVIDKVQIEDIGGEDKPVMYFSGKERGLVLNKTNAGSIAALYGGETDGWIGKEVKLYPTKVSFQGSMVDAIRVKLEPPEATEDDEIPF